MKMILAWLMIIIPLSWGVTQSINRALPLFKQKQAPVTLQSK